MKSADIKIKTHANQIILYAHEIEPDLPVKINWYVVTKGMGAGVIKGQWDASDPYKGYEEKYPGNVPDYLPMDGQWRDVNRFKLLNEKLSQNMYLGIDVPWYDRRGDAFIILPHYDDEGNPL